VHAERRKAEEGKTGSMRDCYEKQPDMRIVVLLHSQREMHQAKTAIERGLGFRVQHSANFLAAFCILSCSILLPQM
jgi:hypothetical protein